MSNSEEKTVKDLRSTLHALKDTDHIVISTPKGAFEVDRFIVMVQDGVLLITCKEPTVKSPVQEERLFAIAVDDGKGGYGMIFGPSPLNKCLLEFGEMGQFIVQVSRTSSPVLHYGWAGSKWIPWDSENNRWKM